MCCDTLYRAADIKIPFLDLHTCNIHRNTDTHTEDDSIKSLSHLSHRQHFKRLRRLERKSLYVCIFAIDKLHENWSISYDYSPTIRLWHHLPLWETQLSDSQKLPPPFFEYHLSMLYKALMAFLLFSCCLFSLTCRHFWRSFLKQKSMLNVGGISTWESFCVFFL